jgi:hypothetical protein
VLNKAVSKMSGKFSGKEKVLTYYNNRFPTYIYVNNKNKDIIKEILESNNLLKYCLKKYCMETVGNGDIKIERLVIHGKQLTIEYNNNEKSVLKGKHYKGVIDKLIKNSGLCKMYELE